MSKKSESSRTAHDNTCLTLHLTNSYGQTSVAHFKPGIYTIGRAEDCAIRFKARAKGISNHHARLTVEMERVIIEDLESSTGTMVNGRVIHRQELDDGDIVSIVKVTMRIGLPERERERESSKVILPLLPMDEDEDEKHIDQAAQELATELKQLNQLTIQMIHEIGKRIIGQERVVRMIWATILAKGHCLLVGVPGLAKTLMVSTFAEVLGIESKRIQFTPDLMPSDIIGSNVIHEDENSKRYFEFVQGPVFTQLLLADEINRTPPKTQAALLEAMQERQVTVANKSLTLPDPFCVIATQNPIEQEGTYPLPEAQLDRFMLCLNLSYPEYQDEVEILLETTRGNTVQLDEIMNFEDILRFQGTVNQIAVSRRAAIYATHIIRATRPEQANAPDWVKRVIDWGAGPRAGQALLRTAKALAAMEGRPAISVEDVRDVAPSVLRHRISCNFRARTEGLDEESIIIKILDSVKEV